MVLSKNYEENRDLLTEMLYKRNTVEVAKRSYTYDNLARPVTRVTQREGSSAVTDSFAYNGRSELSSSTGVDYTYDNIGNRHLILSGGVSNMYTTNRLNQYTVIHSAQYGMLTPEYDRAGNQTKLRTTKGTWNVTYDANNRPVQFTSGNGSTVIDCAYDYMGRRISKKVTRYDNVVEHRRFIYRGYLQIGAYDVNTGEFDYFLLRDPTEPVATRPLGIRIGADWYAYGIDLTKNVCELFDAAGAIATRYDYTPYGQVTATGNVAQPIQWSSEFADTDLDLIYYNYRHYNPRDGRWISRDPIGEKGGYNLYGFVGNSSLVENDYIGLTTINNFDNYKNYDEDLLPLNKKHELIVTFNCAGLATRTFKIMNLDELLNNYLLKGKAIRCLDRCEKCQIKFWLWVYDTIPILILENEEKVYEQDRKKDFHVVAGKVSCEDGSDKANVFSKNGMRPIEGPAIGSTFRPKVREQARENSPTNEPMLRNGKRVDIWRDKIVEFCFCLNHENIESK